MRIQFTWDPSKAALNVKRHDGVSFEEAVTVFRDPLAVIFDDPAHSEDEFRELIIGYSKRNRLLIISYVEREDIIRIVSARKADGKERTDYEKAKR